eukprot:Colp12_sorted_trinity150504_noHs@21267
MAFSLPLMLPFLLKDASDHPELPFREILKRHIKWETALSGFMMLTAGVTLLVLFLNGTFGDLESIKQAGSFTKFVASTIMYIVMGTLILIALTSDRWVNGRNKPSPYRSATVLISLSLLILIASVSLTLSMLPGAIRAASEDATFLNIDIVMIAGRVELLVVVGLYLYYYGGYSCCGYEYSEKAPLLEVGKPKPKHQFA